MVKLLQWIYKLGYENGFDRGVEYANEENMFKRIMDEGVKEESNG